MHSQSSASSTKPDQKVNILLSYVCGRQSVTVQQVPPRVDQESVEIDDFLDNSTGGSSFLSFTEEVEAFGNRWVYLCFIQLCVQIHQTLCFSDQLGGNKCGFAVSVHQQVCSF